jgi:PAS domain S-box-containing protein
MRHGASVLYGEDDADCLARVRSRLGGAAAELPLETASTFADFVMLARTRRHSVLLVRHHPPVLDALEAVKQLRLERIDTPVIVLTRQDVAATGARALRLGADALWLEQTGWLEELPGRLREIADRRRPSLLGPLPPVRPHRALLLESDAGNAARLLRHLGEAMPTLSVEVAGSVATGLERLAEACDFDLLLAVHRPPQADAVAFVQGARDRRFHLPLVLIGEAADDQAVLLAFTLGASDYVVRGETVDVELPLRIELAIERAELAQANERAAAELVQRQRTLGALRESEKQLDLALAAGRIGLWTWHISTGESHFSSHWKAQLGYADHEIGNQSAEWEARCHPDDLAAMKEAVRRYLRAPWPDFTFEYRMRHKDGLWRSFLLHADLETDAQGRPVRIVGSQVDVTGLKQQQRDMAGTSARLQQLSRRLLEVQERERRHLARELHDEIGQVLTVTKMRLQSSVGPGQTQEAVALLDRLLAQVRSLSLNLRPPLLDDLGLVPALHWLVQQPQARASVPRVQLSTAPELGRFEPTMETACFRIAQEALTNALRHARARTITVSVTATAGNVRLAVVDDGVGFDAAAARTRAEAGASLGLLGMHERALLAGGTLTLLSAPGRGTEVEAVFPLSNAGDSASMKP